MADRRTYTDNDEPYCKRCGADKFEIDLGHAIIAPEDQEFCESCIDEMGYAENTDEAIEEAKMEHGMLLADSYRWGYR